MTPNQPPSIPKATATRADEVKVGDLVKNGPRPPRRVVRAGADGRGNVVLHFEHEGGAGAPGSSYMCRPEQTVDVIAG